MRLTLVQLSPFAKWSKLKLDDEDLQSLEAIFLADPQVGDVIPGAGGLRKVRFAPPSWHTGKRGGARVIYAFIAGETVYLFTLYAKNERTDISPEEKKLYRQTLQRLQEFHRRQQPGGSHAS
jgi:hypothetical protein